MGSLITCPHRPCASAESFGHGLNCTSDIRHRIEQLRDERWLTCCWHLPLSILSTLQRASNTGVPVQLMQTLHKHCLTPAVVGWSEAEGLLTGLAALCYRAETLTVICQQQRVIRLRLADEMNVLLITWRSAAQNTSALVLASVSTIAQGLSIETSI